MKRKIATIACLLFALFGKNLPAQSFDIYVSDAGNFNKPPWQILKFDENGQNGQVFIKDHVFWPQDIVFVESKNWVLIANLNTSAISKFDATTGAFIDEFATDITEPTRMEIGADGLLYALQWSGSGKVRRYNLDGTSLGDFTNVGVSNSIGMAWDASGNLYVSSYDGKFVRKFGPTGNDLGKFVSTNLVGPTNIWFDADGNLVVVDYLAGAVKRFSSTGAFLGVLMTGLPQGEGVDFFPNGDIALGCGALHSVRLYDKTGVFKKNLVAPGSLGLLTPNAVVFRQKSASATREVFKETVLVVPNVGNLFQINAPEWMPSGQIGEVHDSSGVLIQKIDLSKKSDWDASKLPNGVYFITTKLADATVLGQKVVVQK